MNSDAQGTGDSEHPLVARVYDPVMALPERYLLSEHREYLVSGLEGRVLDLGAGTGALLPYFADVDGNPDVEAVEPDPHMRTRARERAGSLDLDVEIHDAGGEDLPFADGSFDAVCASFVFCTIPEHERALAEVSRVLESGGEFRFVEHVRGDGLYGAGHDLLAPCWHAMAGGCNLNRRTDELFLTDDRFRTVDFERANGLTGRVMPVVRGTLESKRQSVLSRTVQSLLEP